MDLKTIFTKITDTITIVFPALVAVLGLLGLTHVVVIAENVEQILMVSVGAISAVCSVWFNHLTRKPM